MVLGLGLRVWGWGLFGGLKFREFLCVGNFRSWGVLRFRIKFSNFKD